MNNNNIVKIGSALKWRSTYDDKKKYYQENITTMCGCIFRCKVLSAQGKSPVEVIDKAGHIKYTNTEIWDVVVDMAYYHNFVVDCDSRIESNEQQTQEIAKQIEKNNQELASLKKDTASQFESLNGTIRTINDNLTELKKTHQSDMDAISKYHTAHEESHKVLDEKLTAINTKIDEIEKVNAEQQKQIEELQNRVTVYSGGVWDNGMLWMNELYWNNGESSSGCCAELSKRLTQLESSMSTLVEQNKQQQTIIDKQQQQIEELFGLLVSNAVKAYDEPTQTIYFADFVSVTNYDTATEAMTFNNALRVAGYDEANDQVTIK